MEAVVWLEDVGKEDLSIVGGKGASLPFLVVLRSLLRPSGISLTGRASRISSLRHLTSM